MNIDLHSEFRSQAKETWFLLAISGGRDSVAMLHLLLDHGYRNLVLCHVNHQLRGEESAKDAAFVENLAQNVGLRCEIAEANVLRRMQETGESLELAARNARHKCFADSAKKYECSSVLIAHHADDQAETILFNLIRGSSGLKGMTYRKTHLIDGVSLKFLRPLLLSSRGEINDYVQNRDIAYREDASNAEPIAVRNRLRNEVMPLLREIMGREVHSAINRAEEIARSSETALSEIMQDLDLYDPQGRIFLPVFSVQHPALKMAILCNYFTKYQVSNISHDLLIRCIQMIDDPNRAKVNLPQGRFFRRKEQRAFIQD